MQYGYGDTSLIVSFLNRVPGALHRRMRNVLWHVLGFIRQTTVVDTKQGRLCVRLNGVDHISQRLFTCGEYELDWVQCSLDFLRRQDLIPPRGEGTVLDVGTNIGVISIGMLVAGEMERAIAIEPDPSNYSLLARNICLNQLTNRMVALNVAASECATTLEFEVCENPGDNRVRNAKAASAVPDLFEESKRRTTTVTAAPLDSLISRVPTDMWNSITLIWMDIQGYEGFAIRGARKLLLRNIPMVIELWPYGMARVGVSDSEFYGAVLSHFGGYWRVENGAFIEHAISDLPSLLQEIGVNGSFENVIFVK